MKRLGSIIQSANRETKPEKQATSTDDTQSPPMKAAKSNFSLEL
jgi:hypothetical protein